MNRKMNRTSKLCKYNRKCLKNTILYNHDFTEYITRVKCPETRTTSFFSFSLFTRFTFYMDSLIQVSIMDENESFHSIVMYAKARALIEYCQIYISQCSELNGKKTDFADRFEKYLSKLEPEDCMIYSIC